MAYDVAQSAYKPVFLTSTINGEIINRSCEPGQNVDLSNVLFVLSDKLVGRVDVDEVDIAKMKKGLKAYITLDAYPDKVNTGMISKISREGQTISDVVVYEILVEPDTVPEEWASGMTANIEFVTESKDNIIICPMSAIREEKGETYVLVKKSSKESPSRGNEINKKQMEEPQKRIVKKGIDDGRFVEIIESLETDEKVVTEITEISNNKKNNSLFGPGRRRN
jgi:multidrug efflux pump subunit AcrA (membrane-fusion protein)